jgi:ankyrin repeat protein
MTGERVMPGAWIYSRIDIFAARFGYRDSLARVRKNFFGGNGMTRKIFYVTAIILSLALGAGAAHSATAIFEENEEVLAAQEASADQKPEPAPQKAPEPKKAPEPTPAPEPQKTPEPAPKKTPTAAKLSDEEFLGLCEWGTPEKIKAAIENGANVNAKDADGYTALMYTARKNNAEVVSMLLERGADVNAKNKGGYTALIFAIGHPNYAEVISMLLERGADVNAKTNEGITPLMRAASRNGESVVSALIDAGADMGAKNNAGKRAADYAANNPRLKNTDAYAKLVAAASKPSGGGQQAAVEPVHKPLAAKLSDDEFLKLCEKGTPEEIKEAIENGANVNTKETDGYTALMYAAIQPDNAEVVSMFLDRGADVNAESEIGYTALMSAARQNNAEIVSLLLDRGADVNAKKEDGDTVLMSAARQNNAEIVSLLIDRGADVNAAKVNSGYTALMEVVEQPNNAEVISLLLERGADVNAKSEHGYTALSRAIAQPDNAEVVSLLIKRGAEDCDVWGGSSEPFDDSVAGGEDTPYVIDTAKKLAYLAKEVIGGERYAGKHFKLTRDIDLNGLNWMPIGLYSRGYSDRDGVLHPGTSCEFSGHFNGNGRTVRNLKVDLGVFSDGGFFGMASRGSIRDLKLNNVSVFALRASAGALVGKIKEDLKIIGCSAEGRVVAAGNDSVAGGLVGEILTIATTESYDHPGELLDSSFTGSVGGDRYVGGLVGKSLGGVLDSCSVSADVRGKWHVGGLAGETGAKIMNCETDGEVHGEMYVGGLVGSLSEGVAESSVARSNVYVEGKGADIGGLIGTIPSGSYGSTVVTGCSASGAVSAKNSSNVGGLVGSARFFTEIIGCSASGNVAGRDVVGGLIGSVSGVIGGVSGNTASGNVVGEKSVNAAIAEIGKLYAKKVINNTGTGEVTVLE